MTCYDVLPTIIPPETERLTCTAFSEAAYAELCSESDKHLFQVLKAVSSLGAKYQNGLLSLYPLLEYDDGTTSFALTDLSENDIKILHSLDLERLPKLLSLRIADVLWILNKDYKMAEKAASISYTLFSEQFDSIHWNRCFNYISHSIALSKQINSKNYNLYLQKVYEKTLELDGMDCSFLSLSFIQLLLTNKWKQLTDLPKVIDKIISHSNDNINKIERAYSLKAQIYYKLEKQEDARQTNLAFARYCENAASKLANKDNRTQNDLFQAECLYQKAIHVYRDNGAPSEGENVHHKLNQIQRVIISHMHSISISRDMKKEYDEVVKLFNGLSFKESIIKLFCLTPLLKKEKLKEDVLKNASSDPLSCLFENAIKSANGQTLIKIPPLDIKNPEKDQETLEIHMHQIAYEYERFYGDTVLQWGINCITANRPFTVEDLRFVVEHNPIIPEGRERIILLGLYYGLSGDLYLALHILCPQVENIFRNIAESAGGITTTLNTDDTSQEKVLGSIFDNPELVECYDPDILFMFKGMMNEKAGANIRNEIAHGLMSENKSKAGEMVFYFCWVLKLLLLTSEVFREPPINESEEQE